MHRLRRKIPNEEELNFAVISVRLVGRPARGARPSAPPALTAPRNPDRQTQPFTPPTPIPRSHPPPSPDTYPPAIRSDTDPPPPPASTPTPPACNTPRNSPP